MCQSRPNPQLLKITVTFYQLSHLLSVLAQSERDEGVFQLLHSDRPRPCLVERLEVLPEFEQSLVSEIDEFFFAVISEPVSLFEAALEEFAGRLRYFLYFFLGDPALSIFERLESTHKFYNKIIQLLSFREHLVFVDQLRIDRHPRRSLLDLAVQKTNHHSLPEDHVRSLRQKTHPVLYVLVIREVDLF